MKYRKDYDRLIKAIPFTAITDQTKLLVNDFGKYFQKFPTHACIDAQTFLPRFKSWHRDILPEQLTGYIGIIRAISNDVDEGTKSGILNDLHELEAATKLRNYCEYYDQGILKEPIMDVVERTLTEYRMNTGSKSDEYDDTPIEDILARMDDAQGIKWRLAELNASMRPLQAGDFGILAARPNAGKTAMLASELTYFAWQLPEQSNIIYLNNEGTRFRIIPRLYQAALGIPLSRLKELSDSGELKQSYADVVTRTDKIRVFDIHGQSISQVERIIENNNAAIVVFDMIDKIKGFGDEARTDLTLEMMYNHVRELCVKHSFIGLATSQVSSEGEGMQYPSMSMLKDSKTGKQGAADFIMMIGKSNDPNLIYARYLSLPKNKLQLEARNADCRCEVTLNPDTSRYESLMEGS